MQTAYRRHLSSCPIPLPHPTLPFGTHLMHGTSTVMNLSGSCDTLPSGMQGFCFITWSIWCHVLRNVCLLSPAALPCRCCCRCMLIGCAGRAVIQRTASACQESNKQHCWTVPLTQWELLGSCTACMFAGLPRRPASRHRAAYHARSDDETGLYLLPTGSVHAVQLCRAVCIIADVTRVPSC